MVQEGKVKFETESDSSECKSQEEKDDKLNIIAWPWSGEEINDVVAKLQSRGGGGNASQNSIFEILPKFSISAGEDLKDVWNKEYVRRREEVLAATRGGDLTGIIVGSNLAAFERNVERPLKQLRFASRVDFIVWRRSIILVGLSSSRILLVDPKSFCIRYKGNPLAKIPDEHNEEKKYFVDAFIHSNADPTKLDVVVVSRDGLVYKFPNISLTDGSMDSTFDQNDSLDLDFGAVKELVSFDLEVESDIVCACSPTRGKIVAVEKLGRVTILDTSDENADIHSIFLSTNIFSNMNLNIRKLSSPLIPKKIMSIEGVQFVLFSNGSLEMFDGPDFIPSGSLKLPTDSMVVHDFTLVLNINEGTVKLWALYGNGGESFIGIFGSPCFTSEFTFQLPSAARGVFKFPTNVSPFEEPASILEMGEEHVRLYDIQETSTDVTLQKLLSRGKYAEAEDLASKYNKDLDIVRKAEAKDKLNRIAAVGRDAKESQFRDLLSVLKKIVDAEFVCKFCVRAHLPNVPWVKDILGLAKGRVPDCSGSEAANLLLLTIKKFYTFELVYPAGTIGDWNAFISEDNTMLLQAIKFLQNKCYAKCERVWRRHSEDFVPHMGLAEFLPFFITLFDHQLVSAESKSLLQTILPFAVEKVAGCPDEDVGESEEFGQQELQILKNIVLRQVSSLEGHVNWPLNALNFVNAFNAVIQQEGGRLEGLRSERESWSTRKKIIVQNLHSNLNYLIQVLEELAELKRNHSIRIAFSDYTENEISEVINKLLYKLLSKEEVEGFVADYLRPYAERKRLNVDVLFAQHIKSVLMHIHYYHQAINIPHEERMVTLINLISSSRMKLRCTLEIAEEWPVPWTSGIDNVVKQILHIYPREKLNTEHAAYYDKIRLLQKQVPYRCVLRKYRLNEVKLGRSQCYITMAILRILKQKKNGYLEDCKELLNNIPGSTLLDEIRLEYLEFCIKLENAEIDLDELVTMDFIKNTKLRKAICHRVFVELQQLEDNDIADLYTPEERNRLVELYTILTSDSKDPRQLIMAKLKQFLPNLPMSMVYSDEFPYSVLTRLFEFPEKYYNNPAQLIVDCKRLSHITDTYLPDILLTAGAFFTQYDLPGNSLPILWSLVELIVSSPLSMDQKNSAVTSEMVQTAGYNIATYLLPQCPSLTLAEMETLHSFLCRLLEFDKVCEEVAKLLFFYRIFLALKEQEVPLENDFLEVYKWLAGEGRSWNSLQEKMGVIGETLLKFEDFDLFNSVFYSIRRHLVIYTSKLERGSGYAAQYAALIGQIDKLRESLWNQRKTFVPPSDRLLDQLVKQLNEAGIRVNQYAVKLRNKEKLLERLLQQKNYVLASDLAIYFRYYDDLKVWSGILKGFVQSGKYNDLRMVLESVRTVPTLWMLPEFSEAWKKVAEEVDKEFLDLCPIPLD